jgi:hypothetical protein
MTEFPEDFATDQSLDDRRRAKEVPMSKIVRPPSVLNELVKRFQVCWQVWPEYAMVGREKRQIGFTLDLYGTHGPGPGHVDPGCRHCHRVFAALSVIADWILPRDEQPSRYELESYNPSISYSPGRGNRPDVTLTIRVLHRDGFERPVDDCEARCLKEMQQRLRELAACERQWSYRQEAV